MRKVNLIKEINIPYASPIVCVPKPNSKLQVCTDFRMVNRNINNNAYLMY